MLPLLGASTLAAPNVAPAFGPVYDDWRIALEAPSSAIVRSSVSMNVTLENLAGTQRYVGIVACVGLWFEFSIVREPDNQPMRTRPYCAGILNVSPVPIAAHAQWSGALLLDRYVDIETPGTYAVSITSLLVEDDRLGHGTRWLPVHSNVARIVFLPSNAAPAGLPWRRGWTLGTPLRPLL